MIGRNYINSEGDNLTKEISTIQFTAIYDLRDILLKVNSDSNKLFFKLQIQYDRKNDADLINRGVNYEFMDCNEADITAVLTLKNENDITELYSDIDYKIIEDGNRKWLEIAINKIYDFKNKEANLFLLMPNKLIYNLNFFFK